MGISAAEFSRRLKPLANITVLREIVSEEITANEETLRLLKENEYTHGDIFSNNTNAKYSSKSMYSIEGNVSYADYKHDLNPVAGLGNVDLMEKGSFVSSMKLLKPKQGKYLFDATDKKKGLLTAKYGKDIFGLQQDTFNKFQKDVIAKRLVKRIKERLNNR